MNRGIMYSIKFAWDSVISFFSTQPFLFLIIAIIIAWGFIAKYIKKKLKSKHILSYENEGNLENKQFYIDYYKKIQYIDIIGVFVVASLFFIYLLTKDKIVGTVLAVGVGAILITFQSFILSFFTYFLLVGNYKVGNTIRIGDKGVQGEILYIKSLYTGVSGKNDFGESTGEFFVIPNNQIRANPIIKLDLNAESYTKVSMSIIYNKTIYNVQFSDFMESLKDYLNKLLPLRNATNVSHFRSYIGVKYKLDFDYNKDGAVVVWLGFIAKRNNLVDIKGKIITFLENTKRDNSSLI